MSCAACDNCPRDAWHLHVTVRPHWSWTMTDVASALQRDIERHDMRPVVVTNHFHDARKPYRELIPTKHFRGNEADASREIFRVAVLLNNAGWRVKRLKIEGDPTRVPEGRALYYETHIKNSEVPGPVSTNARGDHIVTIRRLTMSDVLDTFMHWKTLGMSVGNMTDIRIEAAVLDTNPDMDKDWINQ